MFRKPLNKLSVLFLLLSVSCAKYSKKETSEVQTPKNLPPAKIQESIKVNEAKNTIGLQEKQLGNLFLLRESLTTKIPVPSFKGLQSRLVYFKKIKEALYLFESNKGHVAGTNTTDDIPLAAFPAEKDQDGYLWFKFTGFAWADENWRASDDEGTKHAYTQDARPLANSYIEKIQLQNNDLLIVQKGFVSKSPRDGTPGHAELRTFITPYNPDPTYKALVGSNFKDFGFFEVAPLLLKDGSTQISATRFNPNKKIQWYISKNTPPELYDAIKEGILYWNKALGKDWLEVVEHDDKTLSAPDMSKNVMQWVDFDAAGFAYADAQSDPLTGETLNAQVFMSSAFSMGSKKRLKRRVRLSSTEQNAIKNMSGFCDHGFDQFVKSFSRIADALNLNDGDILKITQDYIREVVAHEVGHTLGLRHNFAGSLAASQSPSEIEGVFVKYIKNEATPPKDLIITSSAMEYSLYNHAVIAGWQMKSANFKEENPFPYDRKAVTYLATNESNPKMPEGIPAFCTDTTASVLQDCLRFDEGRNVYEAAAAYTKFASNELKWAVLEKFYNAAYPSWEGTLPVKPRDLSFDVATLADRDMALFSAAFLDSFSDRRNFAKTRLNEMSVTNGVVLSQWEQNRNEKAASEQIKAVGGVEALSWKLNQSTLVNYLNNFGELTDKYLAVTNFNAADKEYIKQKAPLIITEFFKFYQESYLSALNAQSSLFIDTETGALFEDDMSKYLSPIVLGTESFSEKARVLAAKSLRKGRGVAIGWGRFAAEQLIEELKKQNDALPQGLSPKEKAQKTAANKALIKILEDEDGNSI